MILVGNKSDLADQRVVSVEQGEELAAQFGSDCSNYPLIHILCINFSKEFIEASAYQNRNLDEIFTELTRLVERNRNRVKETINSPEGGKKKVLVLKIGSD